MKIFPQRFFAERGRNVPRRTGQTMIFLLMALTILTFVVLWNIDLHRIVTVKNMSQNAGDSAALAAARWQGITLNLIGDLNILQAVALCQGDTNTAASVADLQARLCYVGPMVGFMAAEQAAKNNGAYNNAQFTKLVSDHANTVLTSYKTVVGPGGRLLFPEPYPGAWDEYSDMLAALARDGIAAGADNARMYTDYSGEHTLLNPDFYEAIAGQLWCWFYANAYGVLVGYSGFHWWPPLPPTLPQAEPINSEFFGLGLAKNVVTLDLPLIDIMEALRQDRALSPDVITTNVTATWYCYAPGVWTAWNALSPTNSPAFPVYGTVKPQYDYAGADAAIRIEAEAIRRTPGMPSSAITWSAAAKPFGYLNDSDRPDSCGLVLPAFHDIRLIPIDASSAPAGGAFNIDWRIHIEKHLPGYVNAAGVYLTGYMDAGIYGAAVDPSCWYCAQLIQWEDRAFRQNGIVWLNSYSNTCYVGSPGTIRGGGTRRGH